MASQERGAAALGEAILGLGVNARVLMIGAHPDDEDTFLIAWLSRGRHVETAYLSLTRGDGGQNLIGNELGEALGVIRTEELLAARRVDGARQYFTRAYDFGFSKDTVDTYRHWQRDSVLGDVVRVVRAFRPHVIVAVFSGTTRDGHGQHQVSGLLARAAYDAAGDTLGFSATRHGRPWAPLKFYRSARFNQAASTLSFDAGEYSPLLGRSYAEIAGESRSQHKSQGFGALQRKGPLPGYLRREATRVNESTPATDERSLFDGIDTTWNRLRAGTANATARLTIDSLPAAFAAARDAFDALEPQRTLGPLDRLSGLLNHLLVPARCVRDQCDAPPSIVGTLDPDFEASLTVAAVRVARAIQLADAVDVEALADREVFPVGERAPTVVSLFNNTASPVRIGSPVLAGGEAAPSGNQLSRTVPPGGVNRDTVFAPIPIISQPWWLVRGRRGAMFVAGTTDIPEGWIPQWPSVGYFFEIAGQSAAMGAMSGAIEPVMYRFVDAIKGERRRDVAGAPDIAISLASPVRYAPANTFINVRFDVYLRSADERPREVTVTVAVPAGLTADSITRTVRLPGYDAQHTASFRIRGRLTPGQHRLAATAESGGQKFATGYQLIDYDHIRRQRIYRPAATMISAVDVRVPPTLRVAYVTGVGDNVAPALAQLGVDVTVLSAADVAQADLSSFTTVLVGPRAYEANASLIAANPRLLDFARRGGTLVVQYGQFEMARAGIMPFPITHNRPADRVTDEAAPVTILDANASALRFPNRISIADFAGWVQERALYMPRTFDDRYAPLIGMNDTGEQPNLATVLIAPYGKGMYVYTTLSFFRQLPAGVPGAARLLVNLLSAGLDAR